MAQKFLTNIDLNQNQLINAKFQVLTSDPEGFTGQMYYNSTNGVVRLFNGTAWVNAISSITSAGTHTDAITVTPSTNGTVTITLNLADTDSAGLLSSAFWNDLTDATSDNTASKLVKRDSGGNAKVSDPTQATHIATKGYVDAARQGLDVKQSVRVATTAAVIFATGLENADTLDGVTLATGDRILVKDQGGPGVAHVDNGIYVVQVSGAPVRASDSNGTADTGELKAGTFVFVEEGTVNSDKGFVLSTNGTITVGSTAIAWTQFSGAGSFTAGDGLSQDGNTINVNVTTNRTAITADAIDIASTYVGQDSITTLGTIGTGTWAATDVAVEHGGTNASTAATARQNLGIETPGAAESATTSTPVLARIAKQGCAADSVGTSTTVVKHNFSNVNVIVQIFQVSTGEIVIGDVTARTADAITVVLLGTITANQYTIVVTG
jgi:hypothetical protein